jgi:hypothetical protein
VALVAVERVVITLYQFPVHLESHGRFQQLRQDLGTVTETFYNCKFQQFKNMQAHLEAALLS